MKKNQKKVIKEELKITFKWKMNKEILRPDLEQKMPFRSDGC